MADLNARINLEDNFTAQIMNAINRTDSFQQAVVNARRQLENLSRERFEAHLSVRDEATQQITRTKQSLNNIKKNVAIMIAAKDSATDRVNKIKGQVKLLVEKPYNVVIDAVDKTKSIISGITDSIFSLKTLAAGIVFGAATKQGFDWTISNAMDNEDFSATLNTVLHSKEKGNEALQWAYKDAASTPFDAKQVVEGVTKLSTSGLDYTKYLNPLGDAAAAMNKPLDQAIFAMSKLKSGQLGMAVDMFRDFGISNDDWKAKGATFAKNGEMQGVSPQQAVDMVTKIINEKYGGLMETKSGTARGMLSNMGDSISAMGRGLAGVDNEGQMMEGGLFDNFKKQLANIAPILQQVGNSDAFKKLQTDIGELATVGGDKLTAFLQSFKDPEKVAEYEQKFKDFVAGVKDGAATAIEFGQSMIALMKVLTPVIDLIVAHPQLFAGLFVGFEVGKGAFSIISTFRSIKGEIGPLLADLAVFRQGASGAFKGLSPLFSSIGSAIGNAVKGIPNVLSTVLNTARLWVGMIGSVLKNNLMSAFSGIGSAIMGVVRPVIAFFAANPIVLAIMAIVAVGALLYEAWKNDWGGIREKTEAVLNFLKEGFDKFKDKLVDLKDKVLKGVKDKFDDFNQALEDHKNAIKITAGILGTVFGPALVATGTKATIAGAKLAAHFIASIAKTGTAAVINGAKVTASFIASMVKSGTAAVINGAKVTASFIASMVRTGTAAVVNGAKVVVSFIGSMIMSGTQAVINGAKITASFIASMARAGSAAVLSGAKIVVGFIGSLILASAQAVRTGISITINLVGSLIAYAAQGWKTVASITAVTLAWVAQKGVAIASSIATWALTAAQWALNTALDANPIGIVILAIAALGFAIYEVIKHWQDIWGWIKSVWDVIDSNPILKFISFAINPLGTAIMECVTHWESITNAIKGAWDWLTSWVDKWNGTTLDSKDVTINQTVNSTETSSGGEDAGQNALGTSYWKGGLTWVGEHGPELINLNKGAQVFTNKQSMDMVNAMTNTDAVTVDYTPVINTPVNNISPLSVDVSPNMGAINTNLNPLNVNVNPTLGDIGNLDPLGIAINPTMSAIGNLDPLNVKVNPTMEAIGNLNPLSIAVNPSLRTIGNIDPLNVNVNPTMSALNSNLDPLSVSVNPILNPLNAVLGDINANVPVGGNKDDKHTNISKSIVDTFKDVATSITSIWKFNSNPSKSKTDSTENFVKATKKDKNDGLLSGIANSFPTDMKELFKSGLKTVTNLVKGSTQDFTKHDTPLFKEGSYIGYANGTPYAEEGVKLVGEFGPELVKFNGGEQVVDSRNTKKALNRGDIKVEVTIQGNVIGNEDFADYVGDHIANKLTTLLATNM